MLAFIFLQVLGAVLAFYVMGAFINEQNATYADDGTRTVATVESKLIEATGSTAEDIEAAGGVEAFLSTNYGMTVNDAASQLGVTMAYQAPAIAKHKELYVFFAELIGSIVVGLGAGFALLAARKKSLIRGFAYGGAIFIGVAITGGAAILNPAVAGALSAYPLSGEFGTAVWPYVIFILATTVGVTIGFSLYNVILKDSNKCTCGPDCDCGDCCKC